MKKDRKKTLSNTHIPFSVSMCVYWKDNPQHFKAAVESIINQTVKPTEIVLVVDGPVPSHLNQIIRFFEVDKRFIVIWLPANQGQGNARRIGFENCTYELVALMDADDISCSNRFELQLNEFIANPQISIVGGNITEFVDKPEKVIAARNVPSTDADIRELMKTRCPMNQVTVMFRKSDIAAVGGYIDWYYEEDYYLWLRMFLANQKFKNIQNVLVNVRVGKDMYKRRGGWKYFKSEVKLQGFMKKKKVIALGTYIVNVVERLIVQVLLPYKIRSWVFRKFAREHYQ